LDLLRSTYETVEKGLNFQNQWDFKWITHQ
jgi:hypothetical protein